LRRRALPAFAIVRIDRYIDGDEERVTIKRVVWSQGVAEAEVARLNELVESGDETFYFW
jgi:hypothetical protein